MGKINLKSFITLLFVLISARSNFLTHDVYYFILILLLLINSKNKLTPIKIKNVLVFFIIVAAFFLVRLKINNLRLPFYISDLLFLCKFLFVSWLYVLFMGKDLMPYVVKIIVNLAIVSLIFYPLQIINKGSVIIAISKGFSSIGLGVSTSLYSNFLIFSYQSKHYFRNSGFSWEPGAYGTFLVTTLLLQLFLSKFKFTKQSWILIAATITTISTTANLALCFLLLLKYLQNGGKITTRFLIIATILLIVFFNIPFLGDKIYNSFFIDSEAINSIDDVTDYYYSVDSSIPLGRFASIVFIVQTFGWKLILGVSNMYESLYNNTYRVNLSCGIIDFIARFGIPGYLIYSYRYIWFCKQNLKFKGMGSVFLCFLIFFTLGFGETLLSLPFFLMFIFLNSSRTIIDKAKL